MGRDCACVRIEVFPLVLDLAEGMGAVCLCKPVEVRDADSEALHPLE